MPEQYGLGPLKNVNSCDHSYPKCSHTQLLFSGRNIVISPTKQLSVCGLDQQVSSWKKKKI